MPDPAAPQPKPNFDAKKDKATRTPKDLTFIRAELAVDLAREWNSPGDWFQQHLYVE